LFASERGVRRNIAAKNERTRIETGRKRKCARMRKLLPNGLFVVEYRLGTANCAKQ
jgi:hypothetical protein